MGIAGRNNELAMGLHAAPRSSVASAFRDIVTVCSAFAELNLHSIVIHNLLVNAATTSVAYLPAHRKRPLYF
jgi:hypothetical protein